MKNVIKRLFVLVPLALICLMPTMANAAGYVDDNSVTWAYTVNSDGTTATITSCSQTTGNVVFPATIDGYTVTNIKGSGSSFNIFGTYINSTVTSVSLPTTLTSVGDFAFRCCTGLTAITIPDNVTSIGEFAFIGCRGFTSFSIPVGVTSIGRDAFMQCSNLTSLEIPSGVTSIKDETFNLCTSLNSISIPDSVIYIGASAFSECTNLTSITIPSGVTSIGSCAFCDCENLISITLPSGVTSIEDGTFNLCQGLTSITIPSEVSSIQQDAFADCTNLASVYFEGAAPTINETAFSQLDGDTMNVTFYYIDGQDGWTTPYYTSNGIDYNTSEILPDINTAPSFTKGADQTVLEDCGAKTVSGWATAMSTGAANESDQTLTFTVTSTNSSLFSALPAIDATTGNLTYTPAANANGSATVTVTLKDSGGTANGGTDTSEPQTFIITVMPANYTVTFNSNGGSVVDTQTFTHGEEEYKVIEPLVPARSGYAFVGWYTDDGLTILWIFDTDTATSSMTLYAKWAILGDINQNGTIDLQDFILAQNAYLCKISLSDTQLKISHIYNIYSNGTTPELIDCIAIAEQSII